ncbi:gamma carbonic anhydrase family protein [Roseivivax marinus]|uniref:gamma carbonic anhydrase family protein n=1 Tax=Roseivivax marinus TaxID=1379903 RepID=UPI00273FF7FC|nr:gamma carbonic anhydrase family protein [Roseivivax marinus]
MPVCDLGGLKPNYSEEHHWIAPNAYVIGDVTLGRDVGVWFSATIRGDNEPIVIGDRTNIQEGAVLHSDPGSPLEVGSNVTIGHQAIVHGCTIGDNTLIGMGATILNGARIGRNSIVGANALVTEGKVFPDNSLIVGSPAKAVRTLDSETETQLKKSAEAYVGNMTRFRTDFSVL